MSKLIIKGRSDFDSRFLRDNVYLDSKKIGRIGFGETLEIEVEPGNHNLYARYIWLKSKNISLLIEKDQDKKFKISMYRYQQFVFPIILLILFAYSIARINYYINLSFLLILVIVIFAYPLYFLTIGKNRFFRIIEI